jgi:Carboxypeptidase regulatory-like domain
MRTIVALSLAILWGAATEVSAQGGDGSLRGGVRDEQGAAMPGVTVTALSSALLTPSVSITDAVGSYRLINLPPGTYTLTAELTGFSIFRREGILLRAGATFQVDVTMTLGTLQETVTVAGDSPMIEVASPSNVLNIQGEFQKTLPLVEGKFWSDFLHMTPGVMSQPHNDGSGRQNYFGNAVDHRDAVVDMEGMMAGNYNDSNINRTALSTEAVQDVQVKTGGVDAASTRMRFLTVSPSPSR